MRFTVGGSSYPSVILPVLASYIDIVNRRWLCEAIKRAYLELAITGSSKECRSLTDDSSMQFVLVGTALNGKVVIFR